MFRKEEKRMISRPDGQQIRKWAVLVLSNAPCPYRVTVDETELIWFSGEIGVIYKGVPVFVSRNSECVFRYNYGSWVNVLRAKAEEIQCQQEEEKRARFADLVEEG